MSLKRTSSGLGIVEVMMGVAIFAFLTLSMGFTVRTLSQGQVHGRQQFIASRLCQEKLENIKKRPYFRLQKGVTVENLAADNIALEFTTTIDKVNKNNSGDLIPYTGSGDTGLVQITLLGRWTSLSDPTAHPKEIVLSTLVTNPRHYLSAKFEVNVRDSAGVVVGAQISVLENPSWRTLTGGTGSNILNVAAGTWQIRVSHPTHDTMVKTFTAINNQTVQADFDMTRVPTAAATDNLQGTVGATNETPKLLISQVGAHNDFSYGEWHMFIELYNPTGMTLTFDPSHPPQIFYQTATPRAMGSPKNPFHNDGWVDWSGVMTFPTNQSQNITVPPGGYYLFQDYWGSYVHVGDGYLDTSSSIDTAVFVPSKAVAIAVSTGPTAPICDRFYGENGGTYSVNGNSLADDPYAAPNGTLALMEGTLFGTDYPYATPTRNVTHEKTYNGPEAMCSMQRKAKPTSTDTSMAPGGLDFMAGNGLDTNDNSADFVHQFNVTLHGAFNGAHANPAPASPAGNIEGTIVWAQEKDHDDVIAPTHALANAAGAWSLNLSTAVTWAVIASSRSLVDTARTSTMTYVAEPFPSPLQLDMKPRVSNAALTLQQEKVGFVTGVVTDGSDPIPNIRILSSVLGLEQFSDEEGNFFFPVQMPAGDETLLFNPDEFNASFSTASRSVSGIDFTTVKDLGNVSLGQKVYISGHICLTPGNNGACDVPGTNVPVVAFYGDEPLDSTTADADGFFMLKLISKRDCRLTLSLEPGESATPPEINVHTVDFEDKDPSSAALWWAEKSGKPGPAKPIQFVMNQSLISVPGTVSAMKNGSEQTVAEGVLVMASTMPIPMPSGTYPPVLGGPSPTKQLLYSTLTRMDGTFELNLPVPRNYLFYAWKGNQMLRYNTTLMPVDEHTKVDFKW